MTCALMPGLAAGNFAHTHGHSHSHGHSQLGEGAEGDASNMVVYKIGSMLSIVAVILHPAPKQMSMVHVCMIRHSRV